EPIVDGVLKPQGHRGGLWVGLAIAPPKRREIAGGVEGGDRLALPAMQQAKRILRTGTRLKRRLDRRQDGRRGGLLHTGVFGGRHGGRSTYVRRHHGFAGRGVRALLILGARGG